MLIWSPNFVGQASFIAWMYCRRIVHVVVKYFFIKISLFSVNVESIFLLRYKVTAIYFLDVPNTGYGAPILHIFVTQMMSN
ncbi:unnamed protein product [Ixodes persulcatus]